MAGTIHEIEVKDGMAISSRATLSIRGNFAALHLRAALQAARDAHTIEEAHKDETFGPWYDELLLRVPVAVVMGSAAMEASANELIQDVLDGSTRLPLTEVRKEKILLLKDDRAGNAVTRYGDLAKIFGKKPKETLPWQNAHLVVTARNEFMHFRPSWFSESDIDDRQLVNDLKKRVATSTAYRSPTVVFPYSFMTYGCAKWVVKTVLAFTTDVSKLLDVPDRFAADGMDFTLS